MKAFVIVVAVIFVLGCRALMNGGRKVTEAVRDVHSQVKQVESQKVNTTSLPRKSVTFEQWKKDVEVSMVEMFGPKGYEVYEYVRGFQSEALDYRISAYGEAGTLTTSESAQLIMLQSAAIAYYHSLVIFSDLREKGYTNDEATTSMSLKTPLLAIMPLMRTTLIEKDWTSEAEFEELINEYETAVNS